MVKKNIDYFELVLNIIIVLLSILVIYWLIQMIFGGSPTLNEINFSLILILIASIFHIYYRLGKFNEFVVGTFPRFEKNIENSFNRMKDDVGGMKSDIQLIKKKLKI